MEKQILEISWSTIARIVFTFFALYFVFLIQDILVLTVFGLVVSIVFEAPTRLLSKYIARPLAVFFLYAAVFAVISFLIYIPASSIVKEVGSFIKLFPLYFEQVSPPLHKLGIEAFKDIENFVSSLESIVDIMTSNVLNVLFSIFGGISSTIFVISIALFLSLGGGEIKKALCLLFPEKDKALVEELWVRAEKGVGFWFLRIIVGCLFIGVTSYISLLLLNANYPLSLALLAGIANFVPLIGPVLATLIMFMVLALDSLSGALFGVLIYTVLQQVENNIVGPLLVKKFVNLSPVLVLVALVAGGKLFGLLGAVLMVPLVGIIVEFTTGFLQARKEKISIEIVEKLS